MIPLIKPFLPNPNFLIPQLERVLYSGYIAEREETMKFEQKLSNLISNPFVKPKIRNSYVTYFPLL